MFSAPCYQVCHQVGPKLASNTEVSGSCPTSCKKLFDRSSYRARSKFRPRNVIRFINVPKPAIAMPFAMSP